MTPTLYDKLFEDTECVKDCPLPTDTTKFPVGKEPYDSTPTFGLYCLPNAKSALERFFDSLGADKLGQYLSDLYSAWKIFLIALAISFVLSLVYMVLIRLCAKILVWVTFIAFIVFLVVMGYLYYDESTKTADDGEKTNCLVISIILWCLAAIFILVIFCMYDDIQVALSVIEAAAVFIFSNFFLILVPIVTIIVTCCYIAYWIACTIYVYSIGDITQYGGTPFSTVEWDDTTTNLWYYQLLALFWIIAFFISVLQFIIAATAAQWYFSHSNDQSGTGSISKSLFWVIRYHLGSLAFGSLIMAIVMLVRFIFEYMKKKVEMGGATNKLTKCLLSCASCCLKCIGECILYLTKNAYIQIAIRSDCFCCAAREAFRLILRNVTKFSLIGAFGGVFTFFGKLLVGTVTAFAGWYLATEWESVKDEIYSPVLPTIVCFLIAYIIANLFLTVYDLACCAILQCFLVDEEVSTGNNRPPQLEPFITKVKEPPSKKV